MEADHGDLTVTSACQRPPAAPKISWQVIWAFFKMAITDIRQSVTSHDGNLTSFLCCGNFLEVEPLICMTVQVCVGSKEHLSKEGLSRKRYRPRWRTHMHTRRSSRLGSSSQVASWLLQPVH